MITELHISLLKPGHGWETCMAVFNLKFLQHTQSFIIDCMNPVDDWVDWAHFVVCNNISEIDVSKLLLVTGRIEVVNNYQGNDPICRVFVCGIESVSRFPS